MKYGKTLLCIGALLGLQLSVLAVPETHEIDPAHSTIGFKVKHLFSYVTGRFDGVKGTFVIDPDKPDASTVNVTIDAGTINTANAKRDGHLKSPEFFETAKFPSLTFVSKSVKRTGDDSADLVGDLTIHGVTREVPLKVKFLGKGAGMAPGEIRAGWEATGKLKRSDFGLTWNKLIEGAQVVGDEVELQLAVETVSK